METHHRGSEFWLVLSRLSQPGSGVENIELRACVHARVHSGNRGDLSQQSADGCR